MVKGNCTPPSAIAEKYFSLAQCMSFDNNLVDLKSVRRNRIKCPDRRQRPKRSRRRRSQSCDTPRQRSRSAAHDKEGKRSGCRRLPRDRDKSTAECKVVNIELLNSSDDEKRYRHRKNKDRSQSREKRRRSICPSGHRYERCFGHRKEIPKGMPSTSPERSSCSGSGASSRQFCTCETCSTRDTLFECEQKPELTKTRLNLFRSMQCDGAGQGARLAQKIREVFERSIYGRAEETGQCPSVDSTVTSRQSCPELVVFKNEDFQIVVRKSQASVKRGGRKRENERSESCDGEGRRRKRGNSEIRVSRGKKERNCGERREYSDREGRRKKRKDSECSRERGSRRKKEHRTSSSRSRNCSESQSSKCDCSKSPKRTRKRFESPGSISKRSSSTNMVERLNKLCDCLKDAKRNEEQLPRYKVASTCTSNNDSMGKSVSFQDPYGRDEFKVISQDPNRPVLITNNPNVNESNACDLCTAAQQQLNNSGQNVNIGQNATSEPQPFPIRIGNVEKLISPNDKFRVKMFFYTDDDDEAGKNKRDEDCRYSAYCCQKTADACDMEAFLKGELSKDKKEDADKDEENKEDKDDKGKKKKKKSKDKKDSKGKKDKKDKEDKKGSKDKKDKKDSKDKKDDKTKDDAKDKQEDNTKKDIEDKKEGDNDKGKKGEEKPTDTKVEETPEKKPEGSKTQEEKVLSHYRSRIVDEQEYEQETIVETKKERKEREKREKKERKEKEKREKKEKKEKEKKEKNDKIKEHRETQAEKEIEKVLSQYRSKSIDKHGNEKEMIFDSFHTVKHKGKNIEKDIVFRNIRDVAPEVLGEQIVIRNVKAPARRHIQDIAPKQVRPQVVQHKIPVRGSTVPNRVRPFNEAINPRPNIFDHRKTPALNRTNSIHHINEMQNSRASSIKHSLVQCFKPKFSSLIKTFETKMFGKGKQQSLGDGKSNRKTKPPSSHEDLHQIDEEWTGVNQLKKRRSVKKSRSRELASILITPIDDLVKREFYTQTSVTGSIGGLSGYSVKRGNATNRPAPHTEIKKKEPNFTRNPNLLTILPKSMINMKKMASSVVMNATSESKEATVKNLDETIQTKFEKTEKKFTNDIVHRKNQNNRKQNEIDMKTSGSEEKNTLSQTDIPPYEQTGMERDSISGTTNLSAQNFLWTNKQNEIKPIANPAISQYQILQMSHSKLERPLPIKIDISTDTPIELKPIVKTTVSEKHMLMINLKIDQETQTITMENNIGNYQSDTISDKTDTMSHRPKEIKNGVNTDLCAYIPKHKMWIENYQETNDIETKRRDGTIKLDNDKEEEIIIRKDISERFIPRIENERCETEVLKRNQPKSPKAIRKEKNNLKEMINIILGSYIGLNDTDLKRYNYIDGLIAFVDNLNRIPSTSNETLTELVIKEIQDSCNLSDSSTNETTSNQLTSIKKSTQSSELKAGANSNKSKSMRSKIPRAQLGTAKGAGNTNRIIQTKNGSTPINASESHDTKTTRRNYTSQITRTNTTKYHDTNTSRRNCKSNDSTRTYTIEFHDRDISSKVEGTDNSEEHIEATTQPNQNPNPEPGSLNFKECTSQAKSDIKKPKSDPSIKETRTSKPKSLSPKRSPTNPKTSFSNFKIYPSHLKLGTSTPKTDANPGSSNPQQNTSNPKTLYFKPGILNTIAGPSNPEGCISNPTCITGPSNHKANPSRPKSCTSISRKSQRSSHENNNQTAQ